MIMIGYISFGRGSGQGLKMVKCSDNMFEFQRQYRKKLEQLAEIRMDSNEMQAVTALGGFILFLYAKKVYPKNKARDPHKKEESRPYAFTQIYVIDRETYWEEMASRAASDKFIRSFYNGTDMPMNITPYQKAGENLLKAAEEGITLVEDLPKEWRLAYAYMGILLCSGEIKQLRSKQFSFIQLMSVFTLLLPMELTEYFSYIIGGKTDLVRFSESESSQLLEEEWIHYRTQAELFFRNYPHFRIVIEGKQEDRKQIYKKLAKQAEEAEKPISWEWYEEKIAEQSRIEAMGSYRTVVQTVGSAYGAIHKGEGERKETIVSVESCMKLVEELLEEYIEDTFCQLLEKRRILYIQNLGDAMELQNKIRQSLIRYGYHWENQNAVFHLLLLSCEILPMQYEMKWRSGEYYHPTLPLDKELMFQTLSKICGRKRKAKSLLQKIQKKLINMYIYW